MQQPGYGPQQYPPPPSGYPPLSPGYPPQQAWYPPQQHVQQQPVMIQQSGYAPQQSSGKVKMALILAIVVAVFTTGTGIFWAAAVHTVGGVVVLFFWWLALGFGLGGAGCKNACLMVTYIVFGFIYAIASFGLACKYAHSAHQESKVIDRLSSKGIEMELLLGHTSEYMEAMRICADNYGMITLEECARKNFTKLTALSVLLFIITALFATSAGFFIPARNEVKALEFQTAFGGQPPVVTGTGSQTQRTA